MQGSDKASASKGNDNLAGNLLHGMGFILLVDLIALVLGFAFFFIAHGILMGLLRMAPYWKPADKVSQRVFAQSNSTDTAPHFPVRGYHSFRLIWAIVLMAVFVGIGISTLVQSGFCAQNIICIIVSR